MKNAEGFWNKTQVEAFNSLKTIKAGSAYLVNMTASGTITVKGTAIKNPTLTVPTGKSGSVIMQGCPFSTAVDFVTAYAGGISSIAYIKNFLGFWQDYGTSNSISSFEPGKGYYVKLKWYN